LLAIKVFAIYKPERHIKLTNLNQKHSFLDNYLFEKRKNSFIRIIGEECYTEENAR
jgi:hypothetical protein